jgi:hypothetical protein
VAIETRDWVSGLAPGSSLNPIALLARTSATSMTTRLIPSTSYIVLVGYNANEFSA